MRKLGGDWAPQELDGALGAFVGCSCVWSGDPPKLLERQNRSESVLTQKHWFLDPSSQLFQWVHGGNSKDQNHMFDALSGVYSIEIG